MHQKNRWIGVAIVAVTLLGGASIANAQYAQPAYYPPPAGYYRNGLVAGGAIGVGALSASGDCFGACGAGFSLGGHIGGMINPRMAVLFDAWFTIRSIPNQDSDITNSTFTGALQYWVTPIFWLEGGAGLGHTQVTSSFDNSVFSDSTAFALLGALGIEVVQAGPFALDLQGRVARTFHSDADGGAINNFAFLVGFNWY